MIMRYEPAPQSCGICNIAIKDKFYDAKTKLGHWAIMCPECQVTGPGLNKLGTGYGQEYTKINIDGEEVFIKSRG